MPRKTTRNASGNGTIRQRPDGRWEGRITLRRDPGTGKQRQKSVYGKTQKEVRQALQKIAVELDEGTYIESTRITVGEWLDIWIEEYNAHIKESTHALYKLRVQKNIKPALGATKLTALTAPMVQKFCNSLQKGEKPLNAKTVKNIHGVLHRALEQAISVGYIRTNPSSSCKLPRVVKKQITPLDTTEIGPFLKAIENHQNEQAFIVDLFSGIRQGELIGLTWDCIDFDKGTIYLYRQYLKINGLYKFTSLKNSKERTIRPAKLVMETLKAQKRKQAQWRLQAGEAWANENNFVFTNELGAHLKKQTLYSQAKSILKRAGLSANTFHDLRHTYATTAIYAGDDIKTVQENLGHHTAAFTLDVYGHVTESMKQASSERMDKFIDEIKKG